MGTEFFDEWRIADRKAVAAEKAVLHAWLAALAGENAAPTFEQEGDAKRLRATANQLFADAMAEFEEKAKRLKR